jgi:hypothetical protein
VLHVRTPPTIPPEATTPPDMRRLDEVCRTYGDGMGPFRRPGRYTRSIGGRILPLVCGSADDRFRPRGAQVDDDRPILTSGSVPATKAGGSVRWVADPAGVGPAQGSASPFSSSWSWA